MSDNTETREAAAAVLMARWGVEDTDQDAYDSACADWDALIKADLLAALPPVAGPEVRPDETPAPRDRAATDVECGMWAERIRQITATWPTPLGGSEAWEIARYAVLPHLAAPAPAPGDEGLRALLRDVGTGCSNRRNGYWGCDDVVEKATERGYPVPAGYERCLGCRIGDALASPAPAATEVGEGER